MTEIPCWTPPYEKWVDMPLYSQTGREPRVGDMVVIKSRGLMRLALVTKVGRTRVQTAYTTESARRENPARPIVTRKFVDIDDPWIRYAGRSSAA